MYPIKPVLWVSDVSLWSKQNLPLRLLFEWSLWLHYGYLGPCAMCYISISDHSLCMITDPNIIALVPHYLSNDKCAKYCTISVGIQYIHIRNWFPRHKLGFANLATDIHYILYMHFGKEWSSYALDICFFVASARKSLTLSSSIQKALKHPCVCVTRHGDYVFMSQSAAR